MVQQFEIPLTNGEVSSMLTTLEFLAGTIALYCVHVLLLAYWINRIQGSMRGRHSASGHNLNLLKHRRSFRKREVFGLAIAGLCTMFVAITEANLESTSRISRRKEVSTVCASIQAPYQTNLLRLAAPPLSFKVRSEAVKLASDLQCIGGFDLMDFGSDNFILAESPSFYVPTCVATPRNVSDSIIKDDNLRAANVVLGKSKVSDESLTIASNIFYIIPYNKPENESMSRKENRGAQPLDPIPSCQKKRISSLSTISQYQWDIRKVDDLNISRLVTSIVCEKHIVVNNTVTYLNPDIVKSCVSANGEIGNQCLRNESRPGADRFTATIDEVVALVTHDIDGVFSTSHGCTDATVEYEYVLVREVDLLSALSITSLPGGSSSSGTDMLVIVPTAVRVVSGRCEPTFHALALSSLIYAARVSWFNKMAHESIRELDRHSCYWAFFISVARLYFPYDAIMNNDETPGNCTLAVSREATIIRADWYFAVMTAIFLLYAIVVAFTLYWKARLTRQDWEFARVADSIAVASSRNVSIGSVTISDRPSRKITTIITKDADDSSSDMDGFADDSDDNLVIECQQRPDNIVGNEVGLRGSFLFRPRQSVVSAYTIRRASDRNRSGDANPNDEHDFV